MYVLLDSTLWDIDIGRPEIVVVTRVEDCINVELRATAPLD